MPLRDCHHRLSATEVHPSAKTVSHYDLPLWSYHRNLSDVRSSVLRKCGGVKEEFVVSIATTRVAYDQKVLLHIDGK